MNFSDYLDQIIGSDPEGWLRADGAYLSQIFQCSGGAVETPWLEKDGPHSLYTLRNNLSISIAMGRNHLDHFQEPWVKNYPDPNPGSGWVDLLFNGILITSDIYVGVDGGRCALPAMGVGDMTVSRTFHDIMKLLHDISGSGSIDYDDYFARSGGSIVDKPWPR